MIYYIQDDLDDLDPNWVEQGLREIEQRLAAECRMDAFQQFLADELAPSPEE